MNTAMEEPSADVVRILLLDDEKEVADLTATFLQEEFEKFEVITEQSPDIALELVSSGEIDGIVCDYDMPTLNGLEFLEEIRSEFPNLPFILFTGKGSEEIASEAISRGVTDYLQKGSGTDQYKVLANRIQNAIGQHQAEEAVERQSQWYSKILAHSSDYVLIVDAMGTVSYVSPAIKRVMGYEQSEIIGTDAFDVVHPADREEAATALAGTINNPEAEITVEFRSQAADGSYQWLGVRGRNFLADPVIEGIMVNVRDITDRKERETELRRQQAFLEQSMDIIVVISEDGSIDYVSPSVEQVLGYDQGDIIGTDSTDLVHPSDRPDVIALFEEVIDDPAGQIRSEFRVRKADGESRWLEVRGVNQLDDPAINGVVLNARDIKERKEREREIKRQNERLNEFASVLSHDLRNPLNIAEGYRELAESDCDSPHLTAVKRAHDRMSELIDDVRTLARSGEYTNERELVDLAVLAETCWHNVKTFDAQLTVMDGMTLHADPGRLQQLFENLFRNAVEHGGTDVSVNVGAIDGENGFFVEDDGPGIPESKGERVFESGYSTTEDGTGFGLSIVEQVAAAHGWSVRVTTGAEGGARFEFVEIEGHSQHQTPKTSE